MSTLAALSHALPPAARDPQTWMRGLAFGALWGIGTGGGLIALSAYQCGGVCLAEAAETLSLSVLAGAALMGPIALFKR